MALARTLDNAAIRGDARAEARAGTGKIRMTLELSGIAADTLDGLARRDGVSKVDIIRQGLSLRKLAAEAEADGLQLAVVNRDGSVVQRILLT